MFGGKNIRYYKLEINFEAKDENEASEIESACYEEVKSRVGDYRKIHMDMVNEIKTPDE